MCIYVCVCYVMGERALIIQATVKVLQRSIFVIFWLVKEFCFIMDGVGVGGQGREWLGGRLWS